MNQLHSWFKGTLMVWHHNSSMFIFIIFILDYMNFLFVFRTYRMWSLMDGRCQSVCCPVTSAQKEEVDEMVRMQVVSISVNDVTMVKSVKFEAIKNKIFNKNVTIYPQILSCILIYWWGSMQCGGESSGAECRFCSAAV